MFESWRTLICVRSALNGRVHARARLRWPIVRVLLAASLIACASIRTLPAQMHSGKDDFTLGLEALQQGSFETAVQRFSRVVEYSKDVTAVKRRLLASVYLARAQAELGRYREATSTLEAALALAQSMKSQAAVAAMLASLGEIQLALSAFESAQALLAQALVIAREAQEDVVAAGALNSLGTLYLRTQRVTEAIAAYQESEALATKMGRWQLSMGASVNAANALRVHGQATESRLLLDQLLVKLRTAQPSHDVAYSLIGVGLAYGKLTPVLHQERAALLMQSAAALSEAATIAERLGDLRASSHALGGSAICMGVKGAIQKRCV